MTLKEAYEMRRRENLSLRQEVERLKRQYSAVCPAEELEALKRHVRYLEQTLKTKDRESKKCSDSAREYRSLLEKRLSNAEDENYRLKKENAELREEVERLRARAQKAEEEVMLLNGTNKKLESRLNVSFENSSLPSSALPFRKNVPNSRKPSGRKPGGQPGHKPHTISRLTPTCEPVCLPTPESFLNDPDLYPTGKKIVKQLIDEFTRKYNDILNTAAGEYTEFPPDRNFMDGFNLQKRMREYQADHLYFLTHPDVDYTNNISERGLRKFKRKQKQAVVLRSDSGGQHVCDALTIIETARMQNKNIFDTVESAFRKTANSHPESL